MGCRDETGRPAPPVWVWNANVPLVSEVRWWFFLHLHKPQIYPKLWKLSRASASFKSDIDQIEQVAETLGSLKDISVLEMFVSDLMSYLSEALRF